MRILISSPHFAPAWEYGGGLRCVYEVGKQLVARGHEVTVYTTDAFRRTQRYQPALVPLILDGMAVHYFRNLSNALPARLGVCHAPQAVRALRRDIQGYDIALCADFFSMHHVALMRAARQANVPYVLWPLGCLDPERIGLRGGVAKHRFILAWGKQLFREAAAVVAITDREITGYASLELRAREVLPIPIGVPASDVQPRQGEAPGAFRSRYGIPHACPLLLYVGRLSREKGVDVLARAFVAVAREVPEAHVAWVGPDCGMEPEVRRIIGHDRLLSRTHFIGMLEGRDDVRAAYDAADVFALASRSDAIALVWVEAAATGTPVIITDRCGSDAPERWNAGAVVPYDVDACARAITRLLLDADLRREQGANARRMVEAEFTWERIGSEFDELLQRVVAQGKKKAVTCPGNAER